MKISRFEMKCIVQFFKDLNSYKLIDGEIAVSWRDLKFMYSKRSEYQAHLTFLEWLSYEASEYFAGKLLGV